MADTIASRSMTWSGLSAAAVLAAAFVVQHVRRTHERVRQVRWPGMYDQGFESGARSNGGGPSWYF